MKKFLASRTIGFYITACAVICQIVAMICYATFGVTEFSPELLVVPFVMSGLAIMIDVASEIIGWKICKQIAFLLSLYALISYFGSQINYIVNVFVSIDGSTFSAGFIASAVFFILTAVLHFVAIFFQTLVEKDRFVILNE